MAKKTVLITGCTDGGLGGAMAKAYRAKGFRVFATLRNTAKAGSLASMEGIEVLELEVTSAESIRQCVAGVEKLTGGSLDVLVNNAGRAMTTPLLDANIDNAKKVYDLNVWAMLAMVQAFAPMLIKAKGIICNVSSVSGELVTAWAGIYCSSKSANAMLSETLRIELAPFGVRVVTCMLGGISTNGNDSSKKPDLELPPNSLYQKIYPTINRHSKAEQYENKANLDEAAKNIVKDVLNGRHIFIRHGVGSSLVWYCNTFMPHGFVTDMINANSGLKELSK
ncbi:oxidoreductase [Thozetella sp. PMI_491]|nr:oxidoreductase [Thozetella sp. PMI_491]